MPVQTSCSAELGVAFLNCFSVSKLQMLVSPSWSILKFKFYSFDKSKVTIIVTIRIAPSTRWEASNPGEMLRYIAKAVAVDEAAVDSNTAVDVDSSTVHVRRAAFRAKTGELAPNRTDGSAAPRVEVSLPPTLPGGCRKLSCTAGGISRKPETASGVLSVHKLEAGPRVYARCPLRGGPRPSWPGSSLCSRRKLRRPSRPRGSP